MTERLGPLFRWIEPFPTPQFKRLDEPAQKRFSKILEKHEAFGTILFNHFSSYARMVIKREFPRLPLRGYLEQGMQGGERSMPDSVLDAAGYRDFWEAALTHGQAIIAEFRSVLGMIATRRVRLALPPC